MKLVLTGGFLGSGKTTAIINACQQLMKKNKKVAVITNDQGDQQVDSAFVKSFGIATREVSAGCFCCNYTQLDSHLQALRGEDQPDIIFAESVGSCTDLIATVAKPLNRQRPEMEIVICVFADAEMLASLIEGRSSFLEESVRYIYKKQLEEADLLILNKSDLITGDQLTQVDNTLRAEYPGKTILRQNSLQENDITYWLRQVTQFTESTMRNSLEIDYDQYADGEARLAWLDKSILVRASQGNGILIIRRVAAAIFDQIQEQRITIGHLKFILESNLGTEKISYTTTGTRADIKIPDRDTSPVKMLINARVQTDPGHLEKLIDDVLSNASLAYDFTIIPERSAAFKPGYPKPMHRVL